MLTITQQGGLHSQEVAYLLLTQQPRIPLTVLPKKISEDKLSLLPRLINVAGKSGFENVDQTHLVLASGKPVL